MGYYFRMSIGFKKRSANDFGLLEISSDTAIDPYDNASWKRTLLYDFGRGREIGYVRVPFLSFCELFDLAGNSSDQEDMYGAAAWILEHHAEELLEKCEELLENPSRSEAFDRLVMLFDLKKPRNRSPILGKNYEQITSDYLRWKAIAQLLNQRTTSKNFSHKLGIGRKK